MDILRLAGSAVGRNRATAFKDLVFAVATAGDGAADLKTQTRLTLASIEHSLKEAGSGKDKILAATVYVTEIARKSEMDAVWCDWIGHEHWPQRACVGVDLAPGDLVEIVVVAAREA